MSKALARLLGKSEKEITSALAKLEAQCGYPSEDVRLIAENKQKLRVKIAQLGLDPEDTTDAELYHALLVRFEKDAAMLDRALGTSSQNSLRERMSKAVQLLHHCSQTEEMWVVKNAVIKTLLAQNPPKRIAKHLHYRSINSLIKREDAAEVFLVASSVEPASWQKTTAKILSKLNSSDYELRPIKIVEFAAGRWAPWPGPATYVALNKQMGAVGIWPSPDLNSASVFALALLLLSGLQSLNREGYYESLHHLHPTLGWWADCQSLVSDGRQPVSFNLKDIAINHFKKPELHTAVFDYGAQSLWQRLIDRYHQVASSLHGDVDEIGQELITKGSLPAMPPVTELVNEYVSMEE